MKRITGRVRWFRDRDGFGVITDIFNTDYYFHKNEFKLKSRQVIQKNSIVSFYINEEVQDCLCATSITISNEKQHKLIHEKMRDASI